MDEIDELVPKYPVFDFRIYNTEIYDTKVIYTLLAINHPTNPLNRFEHEHSEIELIFMLKGKMTCLIDRKECHFDEPTVLLIPPGLKHATNIFLDDCSCLSCSLVYQTEKPTEIKRIFYDLTKGNTAYNSCLIDEDLQKKLDKMYMEHLNPGCFAQERVNAYFILVMTGLFCSFAKQCPDFKLKINRTSDLDSEIQHYMLSKQLIDYINLNCGYKLSVKELADAVHMSVGNLQRILNNITGRTFTDLLREARVTRAKSMIWRTQYSLNDIADKCGYSSYESFYKQFKQNIGMSPQEYRELTHTDEDSDLEIKEESET